MRRGLAFLLVSAALLAAPSAAIARTVDLETGRVSGERAAVVRDPGARAGRAVALSGRGSVRVQFAARSRFASFVVRTRALPCSGAPRLKAVLDGRRVASRVVRSRRYARLRIRLRPRAPGPRTLRLGLANPRRTRSCNRRLLLDTLSFTERTARAPARRPAPPAPPAPRPIVAPAAVTPPPPPEPPPPAYRNPVFAAPGAPDPMVLDVGGTHSDYYAFSTGERFPVLRSRDLVSWQPVEPALPQRPAWAAQTGDWNPWAPSVMQRPGPCPGSAGTRCFVLFHVSRHGTLEPRVNCIGVAVSPTPGGPYTEVGPLQNEGGALDASGRPPGCGDDAGYSNIDPAPFIDSDGKPYLYFSTTRTCTGQPPGAECPAGRRISVMELTPDLLEVAGARRELFAGTDPGWEVAAFTPPTPVVENPNLIKRGGTYFILYSGGAFNGPYGMGYATSSSPTGPFVKATENPVLREANGVISVGGGALVTGPRGGDWLAYHGREGSYGNPRQLRIDPARFPTPTIVAIDGPTSAPQATGP